MASKNIKGITIEIGGNTTKLQDALKSVDKQVYGLNSDLKNLNQALKLDPKNTELLSQKYDVLQRNISETEKKLQTLKTAQKQMGDYSKLTDEQKSSYNALSLEIAKSEKALRDMNAELPKTNKIDLSGIKDGLKKVGDVALDVAKTIGKITLAVGGALAGAVAAGVKSYAEYEQNLGGVETLFKNNADKVVENAKQAWKTAGVSANEYMSGVTSFSASLLQSLGGDTAKAADVADMAFRDMSDNANKFGTDMSSIQNAYQGFAKQNYTMLDNLKLGYGGTKTEMERLLKDAQKISGVKYDIKNLADVYNAIHVIQNELGVTGTTAEEAEKTISGSANAMKAAFDNFLNGSGSPEELGQAITNFLSNLATAITNLAPSILSGITNLIQTLLPQIIQMLVDLIPQLLEAITGMIDSLLEMVRGDTSSLETTVTSLFTSVIEFITENIPKLLEIALTILPKMAEWLAKSLPTLITTLTQIIIDMVNLIIDHLPDFISAAIDIIIALAEGLIEAIPMLLEKIPEIIVKLVMALTNPEMLGKIIEGSIKLMVALAAGLIKGIVKITAAVPQIIGDFVRSFKDNIGKTDWGELGKNIIKGICDGFGRIKDYITNKVNEVKDTITNKFKSIFGIHSPSRVMRDEIGKQLTAGIGEGIEEGVPKAIKDVNAAMVDLNNGIQASVNPIINPTANSNPLNLYIDKFYNKRDQDIQSIAEELEYYRKNSALATGGK